eukprot:TRINITY_DN25700_c0_g1_i1.p1 TRINITY_DN25700_c0_g1~~TRINITY_DN25700_c0_g1_i1.p1  ORF type:complete len:171 (+),score=51.17 TRINITY_DN25700_c0_g1_i1:114-626(+)
MTGEFVTIILNFLINQQSNELVGNVAEFCDNHGIKQSALKNSLKASILFFKGAVSSNVSTSQLRTHLSNNAIPEGHIDVICDLWKANFTALCRAVISKTLMVNKLIDMDWKFGVVASSSELESDGNTFLQLKLTVENGNKAEEVFMELSLDQFYHFLKEMETLKANLDFF